MPMFDLRTSIPVLHRAEGLEILPKLVFRGGCQNVRTGAAGHRRADRRLLWWLLGFTVRRQPECLGLHSKLHRHRPQIAGV